MLEILTTIALAITAIISPIKPDASYVYIAKASSLNGAVLKVDKPPEKIAYTEFEIVGLIRENFGADADVMLEVARCESELNPKAKNKHSTAKGLFQILDGTWQHFKCEGDPLNAEDNIACGKKVLDGQGLGGGWKESFSCWKNL